MNTRHRRRGLWAALAAISATCLLVAAGPAAAATVDDRDYVMKVLVRGAPLHEANGIWADANGRLYVASVAGGEIAVLNARTGRIVDRLTRDEGFGCADDLTMGPDGSLYWTDIFEGEVCRRAPDGAISRQHVAPGVNPITFADDGRMYVGQAIVAGPGLWEVDPELEADAQLIWPVEGVWSFVDQLNGFDFGPDGMLYSPQPFLGRIVRLDLSATPIEPQVVASGFEFPTAVKFDSRGRLYAVVSDTGETVRIDVATGAVRVVAHHLKADNLAFDPYDRLYVTGGGSSGVWRILPSGETRTLSRTGLGVPSGVALMRDAPYARQWSLYVADTFSLVRLSPRTGHVRDITWQSFTGAFTMPFSVAADDGHLILTSWMMNNVQIWDPVASAPVATWGDLPVPLNAIRFGDDLIVATIGTGGMVISQDPSGVRTTLAEGLYVPSGLAATDDDLWVADWASGIVWQLVEDGDVLAPARPVVFGLAGPEGLAVDRDGSLLVMEVGAKRLTRVDPATGATSTVASGLRVGIQPSPSAVPFWGLSGVTVAPSGTIYMIGDAGNVVYRLKRLPGT